MNVFARHVSVASVVCLLLVTSSEAIAGQAAPAPLAQLAELEAQARARSSAPARVPLGNAGSEVFRGIESFETPGNEHVPNYLRALAVKPATVKPFAHLIRTFAYEGTLPPALKLAMATRIAQVNRSAYGAVHLARLLRATGPEGEALLAKLRANQVNAAAPADRLALRWAELQTLDIHGMGDQEFRELRGYYSDSEIVELTFTVCFFNYFTRMVEGLGLPVESWVLDPSVKPAAAPPWTRDRVAGPGCAHLG